MIFRKLDTNHDWQFGNGLSDYATAGAAIDLNILTRLLSWVGDCFFDLLAGIDWKNRLGMKGQRNLLDADTRRIVLTSFGVTGINSFDSVLNIRNYKANFNINSIFTKSYRQSVSQGVPNAG